MTELQQQAVKRMVDQFVLVASDKYEIKTADRLEKVMRHSILKRQPEILEFAISYMKQTIAGDNTL